MNSHTGVSQLGGARRRDKRWLVVPQHRFDVVEQGRLGFSDRRAHLLAAGLQELPDEDVEGPVHDPAISRSRNAQLQCHKGCRRRSYRQTACDLGQRETGDTVAPGRAKMTVFMKGPACGFSQPGSRHRRAVVRSHCNNDRTVIFGARTSTAESLRKKPRRLSRPLSVDCYRLPTRG